jgi:hypothetical protein
MCLMNFEVNFIYAYMRTIVCMFSLQYSDISLAKKKNYNIYSNT